MFPVAIVQMLFFESMQNTFQQMCSYSNIFSNIMFEEYGILPHAEGKE